MEDFGRDVASRNGSEPALTNGPCGVEGHWKRLDACRDFSSDGRKVDAEGSASVTRPATASPRQIACLARMYRRLTGESLGFIEDTLTVAEAATLIDSLRPLYLEDRRRKRRPRMRRDSSK
jgi:hypothetical protein